MAYAKYGNGVDVSANDYIYSTGIIISQEYTVWLLLLIKMRKE